MIARKPKRFSLPAAFVAFLFVAGCASEVVTPVVPLRLADTADVVSEDLFLDVAIRVFTPIEEPMEGDSTLRNLRTAESHYLSWHLGQTLQGSGHWGAIRLNPLMQSNADLMIDGSVLQSDGETLRIHIEAIDVTGRRWLERDYYQLTTADSYAAAPGDTPPFPYQALLNTIANDLLAYRERALTAADLATIRRVSSLSFAAEFAAEIYGTYLIRNPAGELALERLPPENDPVFAGIGNIRIRNDLFLDAIQGQYAVYARTMDEPYRKFLARSRQITGTLNNRINAEQNAQRLDHAAPIFDNGMNSTSVDSSRIDGSKRRSNRLNRGNNAALYAAALADGGYTFEMEIAPRTLEFSQRSVILSGSVEEQFAQWREILREMHALETSP